MNWRNILAERLAAVQDRIAAAARISGREASCVTLVAVTKSTTIEVAQATFELGIADLGESKPQELWKKAAALPAARWHLIGHLQRNKLDRTVPLVGLVHSVDSPRLLEALDAFGTKCGTPTPILLEVNCSRETSKGGFSPEDLPMLGDRIRSLNGVELLGLMTMAAYSENPETARPTFAELRSLRDSLRASTGLPLPHLSMGMSADYAVAVEEGATHVRIGTTLFEGVGEPASGSRD